MMSSSAELLAIATKLAAHANSAVPVSLDQLEGGKNNRVFRVRCGDGSSLILKSYFYDPRDTRDRLSAEWTFLSYAWARAVRTIPEPLSVDPESRTALYSFVEGRKLRPDEISASEIDAAADFVLAINGAPRADQTLSPGSEACFSIEQHIETVERRVGRLRILDPKAPHRDQARDLVETRLVPIWDALKRGIVAGVRDAGIDPVATLSGAACCLSPSDFGFHNALSQDDPSGGAGRRITFLDFEYAGLDDPAKLVCDFFCQPEIAVPPAWFDRFLARLKTGLKLGPEDEFRCRILLDAYRVKWTCIMLNDFLPVGAARRAFADGGAWSDRCATQVRKAAANLQHLVLP